MLNYPITDSHIHLWDIIHLDYSWLAEIPTLNKTHLPADFHNDAKSYSIDSVIFVQAECLPSQSLDEVQWVSDLAIHNPNIKGIVAWAPLERSSAAKQHLSHLQKNSLVKGIRRIIQFEDDFDFCLQAEFIEGVQLLADLNLPFDICVKTHQLPQVINMVEQCPRVKFVLNHMGKPNIDKQEFEPWKKHLSQLAHFPNVWCKISGLVTEADHQRWENHHLEPYISHSINEFVFDRVMFGSDWPVLNLAANYTRWIESLCELLKNHPSADLKKLFHDNAHKFYGLN